MITATISIIMRIHFHKWMRSTGGNELRFRSRFSRCLAGWIDDAVVSQRIGLGRGLDTCKLAKRFGVSLRTAKRHLQEKEDGDDDDGLRDVDAVCVILASFLRTVVCFRLLLVWIFRGSSRRPLQVTGS